MNRRGFTIVEMIITITIITILTTLAIVSLRSTQIAARDDERAAKAQTIANGLEAYYQHGFTHPNNAALSKPAGQYPSANDLASAINENYLESWLTGVELSTLRFTWQKNPDFNLRPYQAPNIIDNGDLVDITAKASDTDDLTWKILYEPLQQTTGIIGGDNDRWQSCTGLGTNPPACTRFNLYYVNEKDGSLITIRSKQG